MTKDKVSHLKPLIDSRSGAHVSIYLDNQNSPDTLKTQLQERLAETEIFLSDIMDSDERRRFLKPLYNLLESPELLGGFSENVGLFRSKSFFRALSIPVKTPPLAVVATTFHVKPLLNWLQNDRDWLFLGLDWRAAHLYLGNKAGVHKLDSIYFSSGAFADQASIRHTLYWVNEWLAELFPHAKLKLFYSGKAALTDLFTESVRYPNTHEKPITNDYNDLLTATIASKIRRILRKQSKKQIKKAFSEFDTAKSHGLAITDLFAISRAAIEGRIEKLIVCEDTQVFGKLDFQSGKLQLHPFDMDHEDDDVLDDLAQAVFLANGSVIVAPKALLPTGSSVIAILKKGAPNHSQQKALRLRLMAPVASA